MEQLCQTWHAARSKRYKVWRPAHVIIMAVIVGLALLIPILAIVLVRCLVIGLRAVVRGLAAPLRAWHAQL